MPDIPSVPGSPGPMPPARKTQTSGANENLSAGLSDLAKIMADGPKAMEQLGEALAKMKESIKTNTEAQKEYTKNVQDAVDLMEDMLGNIKSLKTESGKLKLFKAKDLEDAEKINESLEKIQAGYTALKKAGPMVDRSQTRWLKDDMTKVANAMKEMSKGIDTKKLTTFTKQVSSIAKDAQKAAKAFEKIDFTKQVKSAKVVGGSFKGMAQSLALMTKNMQGAIGTMTRMQNSLKRGRVPSGTTGRAVAGEAGRAVAYTHRGTFPLKGTLPQAPRSNSYGESGGYGGIVRRDKHGFGKELSGFANLISPGSAKSTPQMIAFAKAQEQMQKYNYKKLVGNFAGAKGITGTREERGAALERLNEGFRDDQGRNHPGFKNGDSRHQQTMLNNLTGGRGGIGGMMDRFIAKKVLSSGGTGMIGKLGGSLMGEGGGSALGGLTGVIGKLSGPLAVITGILDVMQAGTDRNKATFGALGGGGMIQGAQPGHLSDTYNSWTSALSPGWNLHGAAKWGVDFDTNANLMKQVVNSGVGVGGMQNGHQRGAMGALEGGRATDIYSGIMRNSYMFSQPLGMTKEEGAQNTMKFMKDFSLSMGEVEDLFIGLNRSVKVTGISTTAYLNLLDGITSQFDKMNKSLLFATGLLNTLGKNAKYTAEDIGNMAKALLGKKQDLTMGTFAYSQMSEEERGSVAKIHRNVANQTKAQVLSMPGITEEDLKDEYTLRKKGSEQNADGTQKYDKAANALFERYITENRNARAFEMAGTDPLKMGAASVTSNTPMTQMIQNISQIKTALRTSSGTGKDEIKLSDFLKGGDKIAGLQSKPVFSAAAESLGKDPSELIANWGKAQSQWVSQISDAIGGDQTAQKESGLSTDQIKKLQDEMKEGNGVALENTEYMKELLNSETGMTKLAKTLSDEERAAAKKLADENQATITGPLDYIKRMLKAMLDQLLSIVSAIMAMLSSGIFKLTTSGSDITELYEREKIGRSISSQLAPQVEKNIESIQSATKGMAPEDKKKFERVISYSQDALKIASEGASADQGAAMVEIAKALKSLGALAKAGDKAGMLAAVAPQYGAGGPKNAASTVAIQSDIVKNGEIAFKKLKIRVNGGDAEDTAHIAPGNRVDGGGGGGGSAGSKAPSVQSASQSGENPLFVPLSSHSQSGENPLFVPLSSHVGSQVESTTGIPKVGTTTGIPQVGPERAAIEAVIKDELAKSNTNPKVITAFLAKFQQESGMKPHSEDLEGYAGTSNKHIKEVFGSRATKYSDDQLNTLKKDPYKFGEAMYGSGTKVGRNMGNMEEGDGFKYRGRGLNQLTGKNNYAAASKAIFNDNRLVETPDLANNPEVAAKIAVWFAEKNMGRVASSMGVDLSNPSQADANRVATATIGGGAKFLDSAYGQKLLAGVNATAPNYNLIPTQGSTQAQGGQGNTTITNVSHQNNNAHLATAQAVAPSVQSASRSGENPVFVPMSSHA